MSELVVQEERDNELCVLVKVKDSVFAVQSTYIDGLFLLDEEITKLPSESGNSLGLIRYRGGTLPIYDLRQIMGMESHEEEQLGFEQMLEQRKQDHINWVNELKRCLDTNEPFKLAVDPHQCAFGKWYYSYKARSRSVEFHLRKLEEPHARLHQTAVEAMECKRQHDDCSRAVCLQDALRKGTEEYMPKVLALLDEAKQVFREDYRNMVAVVSDGKNASGFLVDEVLSVEPLSLLERFSPQGMAGEQLITSVMQRSGCQDLVLMLDGVKLAEY